MPISRMPTASLRHIYSMHRDTRGNVRVNSFWGVPASLAAKYRAFRSTEAKATPAQLLAVRPKTDELVNRCFHSYRRRNLLVMRT